MGKAHQASDHFYFGVFTHEYSFSKPEAANLNILSISVPEAIGVPSGLAIGQV
jgi:hypothetical protein